MVNQFFSFMRGSIRHNLPFLHLYVGGSVMVFLLVEYCRWTGVEVPQWVFSHLNDLLCIPVVSFISLHFIWILKRDKSIRIPGAGIVLLVFLYSLYFEVYLPRVSSRYTGDWIDVLCYVAGGGIFYGLQRIESKPTKKH